jgi:hypothetical protein
MKGAMRSDEEQIRELVAKRLAASAADLQRERRERAPAAAARALSVRGSASLRCAQT